MPKYKVPYVQLQEPVSLSQTVPGDEQPMRRISRYEIVEATSADDAKKKFKGKHPYIREVGEPVLLDAVR